MFKSKEELVGRTPCRKTGCISLPICIGKKEINCKQLSIYIKKIENRNGLIWAMLNQDLSNLEFVTDGFLTHAKDPSKVRPPKMERGAY